MRNILKVSIYILLCLLLISLVPGCIIIERAPKQDTQPSYPPGQDEQTSSDSAKPVIDIFTVDPSSISAGESATLSWTVSEAVSISIEPGIGEVDASGTVEVFPGESTAYTLTATNSAGDVYKTIQVNVQFEQNGTPPMQGDFAVIEVVAGTEPSSGPCPQILYADITTSGPGTVSYRWESVDGGGYSYTFSESFNSAGTQRVTLIQEMRGLPSRMYQIHILSPNDIISNATHYTTCAQ